MQVLTIGKVDSDNQSNSIFTVFTKCSFVLALFYFQIMEVFRSNVFYLVYRKRQREQEIAAEEAAKKKKEWEKEWEVSVQVLHRRPFLLQILHELSNLIVL